MTVAEFITELESSNAHVKNSLFLKSSDSYGCVYKWLERILVGGIEKSYRVEFFIELNPAETGEFLTKTVVSKIEIFPAI